MLTSAAMAPGKRRNADPLETIDKPRWLKTLDRYGNELSCKRITPMTDLHQVMIAAATEWDAKGWKVEGDGKWGGFYVNRNDERLEVRISQTQHPDENRGCASDGIADATAPRSKK